LWFMIMNVCRQPFDEPTSYEATSSCNYYLQGIRI
jgi:hypothetical protein